MQEHPEEAGPADHAAGSPAAAPSPVPRLRFRGRRPAPGGRRLNLADRAAQFEALIAAAPVGLFEADAEGMLRFMTKPSLALGLDGRRADGLSWRDALHPEDRDSVQVAWRAYVAAASGDVFEHRMRFLRPDGEQRWAMIRIAPVDLERGRYIGFGVDITPWMEAETALAKIRLGEETIAAAKAHFLAGITHELRTPLNAVIGFSDLLAAGTHDPATVRDYATDIRDAGRHLLTLIEDMVECTQLQVRDRIATIERVNVALVVNAAVRKAVGRMHGGSPNVAIDVDPQMVVESDPLALRQILGALVHNALTHGALVRGRPAGKGVGGGPLPAAGPDAAPGRKVQPDSVLIAARLSDAALNVTIDDGGPGFRPEVVRRLGEAFLRDGDPLHAQASGLGLGLFLAVSLTRMLGGQLQAYNRPEGGARVALCLPLRPTDGCNDGTGSPIG